MNDIAEKIIRLLDQIKEKIDQITRIVNAVLDSVPFFLEWVISKVRDAWNAMLDKLAEFWAWFTDKLTYVGNPWMLNGAGEGWTTMGGSVARINDTITDLNLSVDDRWQGRAASQYEQSIEPQRRANTSIMSDYAQNIGNALSSLATGITSFWAGICVAIITLLGALAGAAVATGTIVGLPAVPVLIGLGIAAFLVAAGAGVAVLYALAGSCRTTLGNCTAGITEWPAIATQ